MQAVVYIIVSLAITSAALSAVFFIAWRTMGRLQHSLTWAMAFAVATLQWLGNLSAALFPSWEMYWISVNALGLTTLSIALLGFFQRSGLAAKPLLFWTPPAVCLLAIVWFTVGMPHAGLRVGLQPAYGSVVIAFGAFLILTFRERPLPAEWGAAIAMFVLAASQAAAACAAFLQGATFDASLSALYSSINFLAMPGTYTATGMFIICVIASDLAEEMKRIAVRDALTGLLNRRGFVESGERVFSHARRADNPLSVIVADIDHFKDVNDRYGHETGDEALVHFAQVLSAGRRREDVVARVGGEEFAILLPGTGAEDAIGIADALRERLAASELETKNASFRMFASFGVAVISGNDGEIADLLNRADAALYRSKRAGRNRIDLEASQVFLTAEGELRSAR